MGLRWRVIITVQFGMRLFAEKLKSKIPVISLIISILVAWLVVPPVTGFPMVALFIFFVCVSSLVYLLKKQKTWFDTMLYAGILILSFFTIYRANEFLQFFDILFIIFFGSLLVRPLIEEHGLFTILLSPLLVIKKTLFIQSAFPYVFRVPKKFVNKNYVREYLPTIFITLLVMSITIPLLASANPFFNAHLQDILKFLNLEWLFKFLFADSFTVYIFRIFVLVLLIYWIPRILTVSVEGMTTQEKKQLFSINYLFPKAAMAGLLIIFFITQLQLYFASHETLRSLGYTNSRLTNEVFFQVTIVAFIVFLLAYFDKTRKKWNTRLTYFLTIEAFFLIGIAFKSVYDYSTLNGFTQKRLWGYTSMAWLTGTLITFVYYYKQQTSHLRFMKQIITYTLGIVLLVNILNFDYLISHVSKPTVAGAIDYSYLSGLSPDGRYYKETLTALMAESEKTNFDYEKTYYVYYLLGNIDFLNYKYGTRKDINTFNITEYQEYLSVKDINTESLRQKIRDTQQKNTPKDQT